MKKPAKAPKKTAKKAGAPAPTLVVWVLDETGSMTPIQSQTVSGYNEYLKTLKDKPGEFWVALTRFNSSGIRTCEPLAIQGAQELTDYKPQDCTPLYDAIGDAIDAGLKWAGEQKAKPRMMVVVQTDGQENASHRRTRQEIVDLIAKLRSEGGEIVFLGIDIDLWQKEGLARAANVGTYAVPAGATQTAMRGIVGQTMSFSTGGAQGLADNAPTYAAAVGATITSPLPPSKGKKKP